MNKTSTETSSTGQWAPLLLIMGAVAAWGLYHIIGAIRSEEDLAKGLVKGLIIFGSLLLFFGIWGIALLARARRNRKS